jgi:8-oxo-dGTP pyrophosphatase MutT (NUDIX family)
LTLRADDCELPNGHRLNPYYVLEEKDWVQIFGVASNSRVLTVKQYRHAGNVTCVELPGGVVDHGETPIAAARRELLEETSFEAATWTKVASVFANPARQTNRVHVFLGGTHDWVAARARLLTPERSECVRLRALEVRTSNVEIAHVAAVVEAVAVIGKI